MELSDSQGRVLLDLARHAIREKLAGPASHQANQLIDDPGLQQPGGCFITLHEIGTHRLRGCVGTLDATQPIHVAVRDLARATLEDPRFVHDRVTLDELPRLEIEITLVSPLHRAADVMDFDLLAHGIYLEVAGCSGCFLPQVARESGWIKEHLLSRLCTEKLGLPADTWQLETAVLDRFTTAMIGPEKFESTSEQN